MKSIRTIIAAAALVAAFAHDVKAVEVDDVIQFGAPIVGCLDINDTYEMNVTTSREGMPLYDISDWRLAQQFDDLIRDQFIHRKQIANGKQVCFWLSAGEARYVEQKQRAQGNPSGYFCMGALLPDDKPDHSKPCLWVYMLDRPTENGHLTR
jgi:hypothetical protein